MHAFISSVPPQVVEGPDTYHLYPETSIGIADVRSVQTFLSRRPLSQPGNIVIIHDAHKLTLPAQNAFLKTLEEPPLNSQIYLITDFPDLLLPTVLSRIQSLQTEKITKLINPSDFSDSAALLNRLLPVTVGERIALLEAQNFTRDTFAVFLNNLEYLIHEQIVNRQPPVPKYDLLVQLKKYLTANVTLRLVLIHFALNL